MGQLVEYTPAKYARQRKKVVNSIKDYDRDELMDACLKYLYQPAEGDIGRLERHPWLILLIIKWAILSQTPIYYVKKRLSPELFNKLINDAYKLGSLVKMPTDYAHHNLFFRNISFQQFIYQRDFSLAKYARQSLLFGSLENTHKLNTWFQRKHNLSIESFIALSFVLLSRFASKKIFLVNTRFFSPLYPHYGAATIDAFLKCVSVDIKNLKKKIEEVDKSKGGYQEYYEQTSFLKFPLIRNNDSYYCVYPEILFRSLETFINDSLKYDDPERFVDSFSPVFERYLKQSIEHSGKNFIEEKQIKSFLPNNVKSVDFVIKEDGANIFIDAKAVEMPYIRMVTDRADIILGRVKGSVLKAISQACELNEYIYNNNNNVLNYERNNYLIVVTSKELYLGSGKSFYEVIAKDKIDSIYENLIDESKIGLDRIFLVSIGDFDIMAQAVRSKGLSYIGILEKAIKDDLNPETRKFDFSQHITSIVGRDNLPDYLTSESDRIIDQFKGILT